MVGLLMAETAEARRGYPCIVTCVRAEVPELAVRQQVNAITHWGSGSTESGNTFAAEHLASGGQQPSQWLLFMGEHGVTAEYQVRL